MPPTIVRPELPLDKWQEVEKYLLMHWPRARDTRKEQIEEKRNTWEKNYKGLPREKERSFPWPKSSNVVVKLARMFLDTFVARTLNIIFATRPVYVCSGFPSDVKDALEYYVNAKALEDWKHYPLARRMLTKGNKNGTAIIKTVWLEDKEFYAVSPNESKSILTYAGPRSSVMPFDDFFVYPITAEDLDDVVIKFHRLRFVYEVARERALSWKIRGEKDIQPVSEDDLRSWLQKPNDIKREEQQEDAGVVDNEYEEIHVIECEFKFAITNNDELFRVVATICPKADKLIDLYYYPYPLNVKIYNEYVPFPQDDFFFGESMCEIVSQSQEEASQIHNDRRNNSLLANTVTFKRRNGAMIPNPSSNYYPGKVFDVESMEDLDVLTVGRNYVETLQEEDYVINFAEKLLGIGPPMQGAASGANSKRGIYNTQGVLGVMAEGNQRQDTNIRDARSVLGAIARNCYLLQSQYGAEDPYINLMPQDMAAKVRHAMQNMSPEQIIRTRFEVKASDSGANKEIHKSNLMQMAQVLGQYGATTAQLAGQLANQQLHPSIRMVLNDVVTMHKWMASSLLRAFDEHDTEGILPDVAAAIESAIPGGSKGSKELGQEAASPALELGGTPNPGTGDPRAFLGDLLQTYGGSPTAPPANGMGG